MTHALWSNSIFIIWLEAPVLFPAARVKRGANEEEKGNGELNGDPANFLKGNIYHTLGDNSLLENGVAKFNGHNRCI